MPDSTRAPVRPRILSPETGDSLLLEEAVRELFELGRDRVIWLSGEPGSGKSTAIEHLRATFSTTSRMMFLDSSDPLHESKTAVRTGADYQLVLVTTSRADFKHPTDLVWNLARWSRDELIEYLLAVHPAHCASVMSRITEADLRDLDGCPQLWRPVLDRLAANDQLTVRSALRDQLHAEIPEGELATIGSSCLQSFAGSPNSPVLFFPQTTAPLKCERWLRHRMARLILASELLANSVVTSAELPDVHCRHLADVIQDAAGRLRGQAHATGKLQAALRNRAKQSLAASLLHAIDQEWKPRHACRWNLTAAKLAGVKWPRLKLKSAQADFADFSGADLAGVHWQFGHAAEANFRRANLQGANLSGWNGTGANLAGANLTAVQGRKIVLSMADLTNASLCDANLQGGGFLSATLHGAAFHRAILCCAWFHGSDLEDCDFQDADLTEAILSGLDLRGARFDGVRFRTAKLDECNLENMELNDADFTYANLERALLTGSTMRRCKFDRAYLCNAGLAEIDWEGVSLRWAQLQGASFHLGSSRSGLVGSPIACEGSRTGFYTDDYLEQDYRPPEDIRKANLRGCDLRGADIEGVDFYLVDLRDAKYDARQAGYFRRCGAILEDRCRS